MTGLLLALTALCIWVYQDAQRRQLLRPWVWTLLVAILGPLGIAIYWAKRPLYPAEYRVGGYAWVMTRSFVVAMTAWIGMFGAVILIWLSTIIPMPLIIALILSVGVLLAAAWSLIAFLLLLTVWLLRDGNNVEQGPTHPLLVGQPLPIWGDRVLKVIFFGGLLMVFMFTEPATPEWMEQVEWQTVPGRIAI